jgi:uncharacterized protein (TIGR03067 family)
MRVHTILVLAAGLLLAADAPKDDATKKDVEKFQGTWTAAEVVINGMDLPEDQLKELKLTIDGNKRTLKVGDAVRTKSTFKLDPSKSPKHIDITIEEGPQKGTYPGIYEITADTQKLCLALEGGGRPKEFSSKADSGHLYQVFKREKK